MCPRNPPSRHSPLAMHLSTERENSQFSFIRSEESASNFCCPSAEKVLAPRASKCARARAPVPPRPACPVHDLHVSPLHPARWLGARAPVSHLLPGCSSFAGKKLVVSPGSWCSSCSSWRCKARKRWLCFRCGEIAARASPAKTVGLPLHAALSSTPPRAAQTCSPPSDLPCRICRRPTVWTRSRKPTPLPVRCRRRCPTSKRACHRRRRRCQRACRRQMSRPMVQPKT